MNMDRLRTEEGVKIIKPYYKSGDANVVTFRALRGDYSHNRLTVKGIGKIIKKFEKITSVTDVVRPVHHRNVRTAENIAS